MKQSEFLEIIEQNKGKHRQPIEVLVQGRKQEQKITSQKETKLVVYYDIQDISSPTTISTNYDQSIKSFEINGEVIEEGLNVPIIYQFDTVGEHIIKYEFKNPTKVGNDSPLFYNLATVKKIIIPDTFTTISNNAFNSRSGLTSVTIGNNVTSIGANAFRDCRNLTNVTIGNSVTSIDTDAFTNCYNLTSIIIPDSVVYIGGHAFSYSGLTSVTIPNSVTSIGDRIFNNCTSLTSVIIPNNVISIGSQAFNNCTSLTSVTVEATTAPTIQSNTFQNIKTNGTLIVPIDSSGYDIWMGNQGYYLGYYNWTKIEQ